MKDINASRIRISIICYSVSVIIFLVIYLFGVYLKPGDELGYCLLWLYTIMPLTALIASSIISMKRGYFYWFYPIFSGLLGVIIPYLIFGTFEYLGSFLAFIPALTGFTFGLARKPKK